MQTIPILFFHLQISNVFKEIVILVKRFLEIGCNVNVTNEMNQTPLHLASENGHYQIVELLLDYDAEIDKADVFQQTALHLAANEGFMTIVQKLLKHGAKIDLLDSIGRSALYMAIWSDKLQVAELLLKHGAKDHGFKDIDISSILSDASYEGCYEVCRILLENGANVDGLAELYTPLHYAADEGHLEIIELLIKNGANVNFRDDDFQSPFHGAAIRNRADSVKKFFDLGTDLDLNIRNIEGNTVFEDALEKKLGGIFKMLIFDNHQKNQQK